MDASIYISPVDANVVSREKDADRKPYVVPNGVSAEQYSPEVNNQMRSPNIGFLGNMAYSPNISAVHWLYSHVFLPARKELPNLTLYVIGRSPDGSILDLGKRDGVVVTGEVDEVWPYLNGVDICVFPLWKGTGLKNKVLEAMYARRPVVASPIAVEGIEGLPGRDFYVCEREEDFLRATLQLLKSTVMRKELGDSARRLVLDKFSWDRVLGEFECILIGSGETDTTC
jgi:glycosyltransferase involved in cell wall biosynthesis